MHRNGQFRQRATKEDSREESIQSLLGVMAVLDQGDRGQVKQLCKRLSSALTSLLEPFQCDISLSRLGNIKAQSCGDTLADRMYRAVFDHISERREFSGDLLSLLTCCSAMTVRSVNYLLDHSQPQDIDLPLAQLMVESGKDQVEVEEGTTAKFECSATGFPPPTVHWSLESEPRRVLSKMSTLTLSEVTPEQAGGYLCVAQNSQGASNKLLKINVLCKFNYFNLFSWSSDRKFI